MALTREQAAAYISKAQAEGYSDAEIAAQLKSIGVADAEPPVLTGIPPILARNAPGVALDVAAGVIAAPLGGGLARGGLLALGKLLHSQLPALLDPAIYARMPLEAGASIGTALTDVLANPRAAIDYVTRPAGESFEGAALHPRSRAVLDFVRPEALWDMLTLPAPMTNNAIATVSPVLFDPGRAGMPRFATQAEHVAAAGALWENVKSLVPIEPFRLIRESYGTGGMRGVNDLLTEHPEIAVGITMPLLLVAAGAAAKAGKTPVRLDAALQDALRESAGLEDLRAAARTNVRHARAQADWARVSNQRQAAFSRLRALVDESVPDPAIEMAVRLLTEERAGRLEARPLDLTLRSLGLVPGVDELAQAENLARLRTLAAEAAEARPRGPVTASSPLGDVEVGPAVLSHVRDTVGAPGPAGKRPVGPGLPQQTRPGLGPIMEQPSPREGPVAPGAVERVPVVGGNVAPGAKRFKPPKPTKGGGLPPERLAPRAAIEGVVEPDREPYLYLPGASAAEIREAKARVNAAEAEARTARPAPAPAAAGVPAGASARAVAEASRLALAERFAAATQGITIPPEHAAPVAQAIATAPLDAVERIVRAVETASKLDPALVRTQMQRLASGVAPRPLRGPAETAIADLPPEPSAAKFAPRDAADIAATVGADIDEVQRAIDRMGTGQPIVPVAEPLASRSPEAAARARGSSLSALREAAAAKNLEIVVAGDSYSLRTRGGPEVGSVPIREPNAQQSLAKAIDTHTPVAAPDLPPVGDFPGGAISRNRSDAGFINLDVATLGMASAIERYRMRRAEITRAYTLVDRFLLGMLSPTEFATHLGPRGYEIIGETMRGVERAQARAQEAIVAMPDALGRLGITKGSQRDYDIGLVLDTLELTDADAAGRDLSADPTLLAVTTPAAPQITKARAVWDTLPKPVRKIMVHWQREFAPRTYEHAHTAAIKRETFDAMAGARTLAPVSEPDVRARFGGQPLGAPRAEEVAAASPLAARIAARAAGASHALEPEFFPRRFSAYASHVAYDALTGGPWDEAMSALRRLGFDPQEMANEIDSAFRASPSAPKSIRGVRYTDRVAALKSLIPGQTDAWWGEFIRAKETEILRANRDVARMLPALRQNIFSRYFEERMNRLHPEQGIPARQMMESYIGSAMQKIHLEPALHRARGLLEQIPDAALRARAAEMLKTVAGQRTMDAPAVRLAGRRLSGAISQAYKGTLIGNPRYIIDNGLQFAIFGAPELMVGRNAARVSEMHAILRRPEFNELLLDMGVVQEAMPYDMVVRLNKVGLTPRDVFDTWAQVNESVASGRLTAKEGAVSIAKGLQDLGASAIHLGDFLSLTEVYQRRWTAAASAIKRAKEMGIWDAVAAGRYESIPPGAWETLRNRMVLDIGNVNFFMGRGSNQAAYIAYLTKRAPVLTRPFVTYTAYKAGASAHVARLLLDLKRGDSAAKMRAGVALGALATTITALAGPVGLVPVTEWIDNAAGTDGAFTAFMKEWQRHYNLVGLISWGLGQGARGLGRAAQAAGLHNPLASETGSTPLLDPTDRIGVNTIPLVSAPIAAGKFSASPTQALQNALESQMVTTAVLDPINTAMAVGRHATGRPPTPEQAEAAERMLGWAAPRFAGVDVRPESGPVPPDVTVFIPLLKATNLISNAIARHNDATRQPGARTDARGRLIDIRTATEEIVSQFGPLARERVSRERTRAAADADKQFSTEKQRLVRALVEADASAATAALQRLNAIAPGYTFDPSDLARSIKSEAVARMVDTETRVFEGLADPLALQRTVQAAQRLSDPKWLAAASEPERRREILIAGLGMRRFARSTVR